MSRFSTPDALKNGFEMSLHSFKTPTPDEPIGGDNGQGAGHTRDMNDMTRDELSRVLSGFEDRMDKHIERMERDADRRNQDVKREIELRENALKNEQALRDQALENRLNGFLAAQAERDKAQLERDKRYELLAERVTKAAEGAEEAAKQAATVKSNYWAAVGVQLLAVAAIVVGAYFANQGNALMVAQTTLAAFTSGKDSAPSNDKELSQQAPAHSTAPPAKQGR